MVVKMSRSNLSSLSENERSTLASLILQYVTPEIVEEHRNAALSGAHSDPVLFLSFHRRYIGGLEGFLQEQGYPQWVPLPAWNPAEPIPEEFNIPNAGPGQLENLNPNVSFSPQFDPENLINYETVEELGAAILPLHNLVHRRIGGVMNDMFRAPEAPIFWPFHSFIDDIWWNWQRITVVVPSCIGLNIDEAQRKLNYFGLRSITKKNIPFPVWPRIRFQNPSPKSVIPYRTFVKLFL
ncbi:MAG: tyrosinase family protein [Desulfocucumaceae bacterium]